MRFFSGEHLRARILDACSYAGFAPVVVLPVYGQYHLAANEAGEVIFIRLGRNVVTSNKAAAFSRLLEKKSVEAIEKHGVVLDYLPE